MILPWYLDFTHRSVYPLPVALREQRIWPSVKRAAKGLRLDRTDRRHLVVVFSASRDVNDAPPGDHLVRVATRADALLFAVFNPPQYTIDKREPMPLFPSAARIRHTVTKAAEATGGKAYLTNDIIGAFRDIMKELRTSYVLRYTLEGLPSAGWHDIVVTVPRCPTCAIRARRGYMGK